MLAIIRYFKDLKVAIITLLHEAEIKVNTPTRVERKFSAEKMKLFKNFKKKKKRTNWKFYVSKIIHLKF